MLDNVRDTVVSALCNAGLPAGNAWPRSAVPVSHSMIRVGIVRAEDCSPGFARYLGMQNDPERGEQEIYGLQCLLCLGLDIYVPLTADDAAGSCLTLFDSAASGISGCGIRVKALRCDEPAPDRASGMMHLRGEAEGMALLTAAAGGIDNRTFSDFVLRGELNV